jgi:glycosyltransferase involved in cell wall biosynthesis
VPAPVAKKLSVFFPMWNEEDNIQRTVDAARDACDALVADGQVEDFELVLVDDASTDATGLLADELAAADPRVRVVHHERNRKLGGSIKTGFATATGDLILYTDADLPFDLRELGRACRVLHTYGADIVSAYRLDRTGEGYVRSVYSTLYNVLVRVMFGVKVRDVNFAGKLVRRRVFDHVRLASEGSFIDAELIVRASKLGYKVVQIGVDYFPRTRGDSTLAAPRVILTILRELVGLRKELRALEPIDVPPL